MGDGPGRLESINTSRGGVPKESAFEALVTAQGLDGDQHSDLRSHGGLDRAVVLYSLDVIRALQREGHAIAAGSTGENLTVAGVDWSSVAPGVEVRVGGVRLLITTYVSPCEHVGPYFVDQDFTRISQKQHPGWSRVAARVVAGGMVRIGDPVVVSPPAAS